MSGVKKFYAHSIEGKSEGDWQTLIDHLRQVSKKAEIFGQEFNAGEAAKTAGFLHDLGKYSDNFQQRLRNPQIRANHAFFGAKILSEMPFARPGDGIMAKALAYAIAGHHAGLHDYSNLKDMLEDEPQAIYELWQKDLESELYNLKKSTLFPKNFQIDKNKPAFQCAFLVRMIFSCLVDADYKDTEEFYIKHNLRNIDRHWPLLNENYDRLLKQFNTYLQRKQNRNITANRETSRLNALRQQILQHVVSKASETPGLFTLTVPTGGGKTLTSLAFALHHAKEHNLKRIIYAVPFTTVIEQNADVFKEVLGEEFVLEHHSAFENQSVPKNDFNAEYKDKLQAAAEDWGAPFIATTNVQLFESLFAAKPAKCRKLHNLAKSIIILDEAQTLPPELLRPTLAALEELALNYGCTIIFCTATRPAIGKHEGFEQGPELAGRELAPDPDHLAKELKRVQIICRPDPVTDEDLAEELQNCPQALVIVNTRKHALKLYEACKKEQPEQFFHLSTRQHARHRRQVLKKIKTDLYAGKPCRLIATSLIEAGVDIDFPRVWRAETGLDQIAQAAGRCNREAKNPPETAW